jgi:hypothetical protein
MARKLADAEAALQREKEEAGRATKEAEQAKAEAQGARESEAAVKHKLADAEAAKAKAEQACHSGDTARPGLGCDCEGGWDDLERQIIEVLRHVSPPGNRRNTPDKGSRNTEPASSSIPGG